jgi:hypothetical protein
MNGKKSLFSKNRYGIKEEITIKNRINLKKLNIFFNFEKSSVFLSFFSNNKKKNTIILKIILIRLTNILKIIIHEKHIIKFL